MIEWVSAMSTTNKLFIPQKCRKFLQSSANKTSLIKKAKERYRQFIEMKVQMANKYIQWCKDSLVIEIHNRKMQIKSWIRYNVMPIRLPELESQILPNADKDLRTQESSCTAVGSTHWFSHFEEQSSTN